MFINNQGTQPSHLSPHIILPLFGPFPLSSAGLNFAPKIDVFFKGLLLLTPYVGVTAFSWPPKLISRVGIILVQSGWINLLFARFAYFCTEQIAPVGVLDTAGNEQNPEINIEQQALAKKNNLFKSPLPQMNFLTLESNHHHHQHHDHGWCALALHHHSRKHLRELWGEEGAERRRVNGCEGVGWNGRFIRRVGNKQ